MIYFREHHSNVYCVVVCVSYIEHGYIINRWFISLFLSTSVIIALSWNLWCSFTTHRDFPLTKLNLTITLTLVPILGV